MSERAPFLFVIFALVAIGVSTIYYRHVEIGVPLTAGEQISIWQVEAEINFIGENAAVTAQLTLPRDSRFQLVEEFTASPAYGVHVLREQASPKIVWSKRQAQGLQTLYYRGSYKEVPEADVDALTPIVAPFEAWEEPYQSSAQTILDGAFQRSGDRPLLLRELHKVLLSDDQNVALLLSHHSSTEVFVHLLSMADVPSMRVGGLILEDGRRNQSLVPLVRVYVDDHWQLHNLENPDVDPELPIMVWLQDAPGLIDIEGGLRSKISF